MGLNYKMKWDQKLRGDVCIFGKFQIVIWNFEKKMQLHLNCILQKLESIQLIQDRLPEK